MDAHSLLRLAQNVCLLLALVLLFDVLAGQRRRGAPRLGRVASGVGLGLIGILIMATPWSPAPGVILDTRTVLLSLSGLFFGVVPTCIAMGLSAAYRLLVGGSGLWTGVELIVMAGVLGVVWRGWRRGSLADISWIELFAFGVVVQTGLLLLLLTLPPDMARNILRHSAGPVLLLFPACTALMGRFLAGRLGHAQLDELLAEREALFRKTFTEHLAVQLLIDPDSGVILDANTAAEHFYGWPRDELVRMRIHDINVLPDEQLTPLLELARGGIQSHFDFQHRLADGSMRFVEVFSSRITVKGRAIVHSIIHDVTDRKRAEAALQESESRLNLAVNSTGLGLWDWELANGHMIVNRNWAAMLGYGEDAIGHMNMSMWRGLCHPDDTAEIDRRLEAHYRGETNYYAMELRLRLPDGGTRWTLVRGKVVEWTGAGEPRRMLGTMEDITARKQQQAALEYEVQRRKILMDNSNDGILIIDAEHRIVETNRRFAEMLGYAEEELIGMHTWEYEAEMDEDVIRSRFADLRSVSMVVESRHRRKDGGAIDVEVSLSGSDIMGEGMILAIVRDISERKQNQAALRREKDRAEAANQAKSEFLANMSHEIRTPLNGILGMLQLLGSTTLDDEQEEYVRTAVQSSTRLNRLLTDVLDLSRVEAGKLSLQPAPFDLTDDMAQVCEMFQLSRPEGGVVLDFRVDPAIPAGLVGDSTRLMQVLINLVGNAFKFTTGGSIEVRAESLPPRTPGRTRVLFSVEDTGVGIAMDKLDTLFLPFTQAHEGYTREFQGAGLGLSICKRLVDLMGGSINLSSVPGEGTTVFFTLEFDAAPAARPGDAPLPPATPGPTRSLSILLAEDDRVNHIATRRLLEKEGHRVTGVETGREAVDRLREGDCDLVLMDIQMPVMNGMEAARAIRDGEAGEAVRTVPIVALTAYAMDEDKARILASGMDDYLTKPMALDDLRAVLSRLAV